VGRSVGVNGKIKLKKKKIGGLSTKSRLVFCAGERSQVRVDSSFNAGKRFVLGRNRRTLESCSSEKRGKK